LNGICHRLLFGHVSGVINTLLDDSSLDDSSIDDLYEQIDDEESISGMDDLLYNTLPTAALGETELTRK
jgi:hypothetical protein